MHDVENELRELLRERSGDMGLFDPHILERVVRRSRVRRALTAGATGLGAAALAAVLLVGLRAISVPDGRTPADQSPSPTTAAGTWRGIWEYTTREQAEAAQAQVDAGHMPWQTDAEAVLEAFATRSDGLGWAGVFFETSLASSDPDDPGPLTIHLGDCPAVAERACPHEADVTIERLLRRDRTGIWSVTAVEGAAFGRGVPASFVGITNDAVVLVNSQTGKILSTIAGPDVVGRSVGGADFFTPSLAVTADHTTVYFSAMGDGAGRSLMVASLDGGAPRELGPGWDPLPSPDGDRLAYVACTPDGCGGTLVIRELDSGAETRVPPGNSDLLVRPVAWLPDGRLAATLVQPGDSPGAVLLIDPQRPPTSLLDAATIPPLVTDVSTWRAMGYHAPTDGVLAAETCCGLLGERSRIVSVDSDSGQDLGTIVQGAWWVAEPDASGQQLLLVDADGDVYIANDGESPRKVADGFVDVDW